MDSTIDQISVLKKGIVVAFALTKCTPASILYIAHPHPGLGRRGRGEGGEQLSTVARSRSVLKHIPVSFTKINLVQQNA